MQILSANDIKKHGVSIIEKHIKYGPVHILKHNRPVFVVLTEQDYQLLSQKSHRSGLFLMLEKTTAGKRSRESIDKQLSEERDAWE